MGDMGIFPKGLMNPHPRNNLMQGNEEIKHWRVPKIYQIHTTDCDALSSNSNEKF